MRSLLSLLTASDRVAVTETNFERIEDRAFKLTPSDVAGVPTVLIGPPVSGDYIVDQLFVDSLRGEFLCTAAGTPGTWVQIRPAPVSADPVTPPDGYTISRLTEHGKAYYYDAGGDAWIAV